MSLSEGIVYSQEEPDWGCQIGSNGTELNWQNRQSSIATQGVIRKRCIVILCKYVGETNVWDPLNFNGGHSMHQYLSSTYSTSFRNYFADMSHNEHILESRIDGQSDIIKWYEISIGSPESTERIIKEAMRSVDKDTNRGWHWSDYDLDGNYVTDQVMVIPSPQMENYGSTVSFNNTISSTTEPGMTVGGYVPITRGKEWWDFLVANMGHEYGHVLGLPELYDRYWTGPADYSAGVGWFCIMAHGMYNRALMSCWGRAKLGWVDVVDITTSSSGYIFQPIQAYRFRFFGEERIGFSWLTYF